MTFCAGTGLDDWNLGPRKSIANKTREPRPVRIGLRMSWAYVTGGFLQKKKTVRETLSSRKRNKSLTPMMNRRGVEGDEYKAG